MYCIQGLFHPARRIRDVYWRIYNNMYIGQADAMTAVYPNFENEEAHLYRRNELEVFL
jgi:splicing factor 3B subunit 1